MIAVVEGVGVGLFGLLIGSFLNVCIHRLPRHESIVSPRSHCPSCANALRWYDNVPVVSFVALGGRCRQCHLPISPIYPLVEVVTGGLFALQYAVIGFESLLAARLLFTGAMIVLFVVDLTHRLLPNAITLPGVLVGLVCSSFLSPGWVSAGIGTVAGAGSLLLISEAYFRVRGEQGLGMGDVKMLAMVGAFLGWPLMLLTLLLASLLGSVVGFAMLASSRGDLQYPLPFGSFLAVAAVTATVCGEPLIAWYLSLY